MGGEKDCKGSYWMGRGVYRAEKGVDLTAAMFASSHLPLCNLICPLAFLTHAPAKQLAQI